MQSIWNALVTDSAKTLDKYLAEILEDLRINLTSNQWRVRESCCEALQDLLRGRTLVSNYCIILFMRLFIYICHKAINCPNMN